MHMGGYIRLAFQSDRALYTNALPLCMHTDSCMHAADGPPCPRPARPRHGPRRRPLVHHKVRLFKPRSASGLQSFTSWLTGMPAEFSDPKFPSYGEGREVTRVTSGGHVTVQVNIMTKVGGSRARWRRPLCMHTCTRCHIRTCACVGQLGTASLGLTMTPHHHAHY